MIAQLAGRFETYRLEHYSEQPRRILYIGKATAGPFSEATAAADAFKDQGSAFWRFATRVSQLADPTCTDRANLVWSNIFKQGVTTGNPTGKVAESQREDSIAALAHEAAQCDPHLIVLVSGNYYEEIPKEAFQIEDGKSEGNDGKLHTETAPGESYGIWSRMAFGELPPIVWMYHPERKLTAYADEAIKVIARVTGW